MTIVRAIEGQAPSPRPSTYRHLWATYGVCNSNVENWGCFNDRTQAVDYLSDQFSGERDSGGEYVGTLVKTAGKWTLEDWEEEARMGVPVRRRA